ncbi:MAG: PorV/PorQ family protein [candidate division Zixibacteria bacterium]|nr:PorV/PorQ family protein [candidate division Zixibacteria bacterium]
MMRQLLMKRLSSFALSGGICLLVLAAVAPSTRAQETDTDPVGFRFLMIGGGARAVGLGETMVADGGADPFVMEYNPAGLAALERSAVAFAHNEFFLDTRGEYVTAGVPIGRWAVGGRVAYLGVDDIPLRTGPSSQPLALYDQSSGVFQAAVARSITDQLAIGLSAAYVLEHINNETAQSGIFGLGVRYQRWSNFVLGAALTNFGPKTEFVEDEFRMPNRFQLGAVWTQEKYNLRGELVAPDEMDVKAHVGVEVTPDPKFALRAGLKLGYDTQVFAGGFGASTPDGRFQVDYAFAPYTDDFGNTHRFGVSIRP